jgi:hypothetical protein
MAEHKLMYADLDALRARGWTDRLVKRFLGRPDWHAPVNHWANSTGKYLYDLARVQSIERTDEFRAEFERSHRIPFASSEEVEAFIAKRTDDRHAVEE